MGRQRARLLCHQNTEKGRALAGTAIGSRKQTWADRASPRASTPPLPCPPLVLSEGSPIKAHSREHLVLEARKAGQDRLGLPLQPTPASLNCAVEGESWTAAGRRRNRRSLELGFKEEEI